MSNKILKSITFDLIKVNNNDYCCDLCDFEENCIEKCTECTEIREIIGSCCINEDDRGYWKSTKTKKEPMPMEKN